MSSLTKKQVEDYIANSSWEPGINTNDIAHIKLKVINVGQGDSMILSLDNSCKYRGDNIVLDCGPGKRDVFKYTDFENKNIICAITHSHQDHIGGFHFINNPDYKLKELWLPLYWDEYNKILHLISKMKNMSNIPIDYSAIVDMDRDIVHTGILNRYAYQNKIAVRGLFDGETICNHIACLNPPGDALESLQLSKNKFRKGLERFNKNKELITRLYYDDSLEYKFVSNLFTYQGYIEEQLPVYEIIDGDNNFRYNQRIKFLQGFFIKYYDLLNNFNNKPSKSNILKISKGIKLSSNDSSLVLKTHNTCLDYLFTGDAGKNVFNRLIKEGINLDSRVLKIPHHGSRHNINKTILKKISPEIAIVCHNNRKFGRQVDPHPNTYVTELLKNNVNNTLYTNSVIKNNKITYKQANRKFYHGITFVK